jgi:CheY-like chemotaxis protein
VTERSNRRTILVVDDEPHVVVYLEMLLQDQGYATVSAANGREGMEKARAHTPDLICLDITMPEESGVRMYRSLKEDPRLASIPVLVVTACPDPALSGLHARAGGIADENPRDQRVGLLRVVGEEEWGNGVRSRREWGQISVW